MIWKSLRRLRSRSATSLRYVADIWKHFFPASAMICDMSSGRSEELNLVQLSRPWRRCRLRQFLMETLAGDDLELSSTHCCFCKDMCYTLSNHILTDQQFIILPGIKPRREGGGGTWVKFCWVCAAGLSEPLPHYSLFCGHFIDAEETSAEIDNETLMNCVQNYRCSYDKSCSDYRVLQ